ncbi:hypothetical protein GPJ56_001980 [Histomonas meleagridis]|uniref:uncharacterized protein n=1 Tax=Histomonas meleagridis TaxID=135588 RepID=UPI00355A2871|nr:hypothetical protein GPJ56_001980 [Histomonas meleagridis]KAH0800944.1 hypothetical protein GO595_006260 [Histomonas meleagridis]
MTETASTQLLNEIFKTVVVFIQKVANENNRTPLLKLYKSALNNLSNCQHATAFICELSKYIPNIASDSIFEFYDWNRSIDDVSHLLTKLIVKQGNVVTITDCSSLISVYNLLNDDITPKILPYAAQREMLDGMISVVTAVAIKRSMSIRRYSHGISSATQASEAATYVPPIEMKFDPLIEPTEIINDENKFVVPKTSLVVDEDDFLKLMVGKFEKCQSSSDMTKDIPMRTHPESPVKVDPRFNTIIPMLKWLKESSTNDKMFTFQEVFEYLTSMGLENESNFVKMKILPKLGTRIKDVSKSLLAILYSMDSLRENSVLLDAKESNGDIIFKVKRMYNNMVQEEQYRIVNYTNPMNSLFCPVANKKE